MANYIVSDRCWVNSNQEEEIKKSLKDFDNIKLLDMSYLENLTNDEINEEFKDIDKTSRFVFIDRFPSYFAKYLTDNNIKWNLLRRNGDRIKNREVYILI